MAERHFNTTLVPGLAEFFGQTEKDKSRLSDLKFVCESSEVFHSFRILFAGMSPLLRDVFKENDVVDQSDITAITLPTSYAAISKLHDMILKRPEVEENNETPENLEELIGLLGITMTSYASSKTNSSMAGKQLFLSLLFLLMGFIGNLFQLQKLLTFGNGGKSFNATLATRNI